MTRKSPHLSLAALETRYRKATAAVEKSHFHAILLLAQGYELDELAEILSFSQRWVEKLAKRYNEGGPDRLGDQRSKNGTAPTILTPAALAGIKEPAGAAAGRWRDMDGCEDGALAGAIPWSQGGARSAAPARRPDGRA
jgi:hypothetical protein